MGFDNECILNIQSLAGEYFCPVCRTLVYPHEALQTQCTHLYCKPCLSYIVSSTQACPYDGYLVTEAGSKPLMESNKALAETIGKTTVHCLYHRSGCVWQGPLAECTTHCSGCAFGNSPVVCNKCGIQIVHRQVQEHAQTCNVNGASTQPLGSETAKDAATTDQSKTTNQAAAPPTASQPQTIHTATGPTAVIQPVTANSVPQAMPAPEMQYYQQYQQYYQQYPGYDPYQQSYQQYYPYQQQPAQQVQQPPLQPQPQPQVQQQVQAPVPQVQPLAQNQPLAQTQGQGPPQPQTHHQAPSQVPANGQPQPLYHQAAVGGSNQNQGQVNSQPQGQPLAPGQMPLQPYSQIQPQLVQSYAQPPMQAPPYQQPNSQMHHLQPSQAQPYPQTQPQPQPQSYPPPPPHFQPHQQPQSQPQLQPIRPQPPPAGHPPYQTHPQQQIQHAPPQQQIQHAPPQQHPMQVQPPSGSMLSNPSPPPYMHPTQPPHMLPPQQHLVMHQAQQPVPPQYMQQQQPQAFPGQVPGQLQGQSHHASPFAHQHPQVRPQAPPPQIQQPSSLGFAQPQQMNALPHGMPVPPQNYAGRPDMLTQGGQPQHYPQSSGPAGVAPPSRPPQLGPSQPSGNQSNVNLNNQPQVYSEQKHKQYAPPLGGDQTFERRVEPQENKSPSLRNSELVINDVGANSKEVKPEADMSNEFKPEDGQRKDEALVKDVSELHYPQRVPGDSATAPRVKEENKDNMTAVTTDSAKQGEISVNFQGSSQAENGPFSQSQTAPKGHISDVSGGFQRKGTEQSSHPSVPHGLPGQQQRPVTPMGQSPSQLRPPGQGYLPPRHPGPMDSDMYQHQRPPPLPGNLDRGPYGPPYGTEPNPARMNGGPPPYEEKFRTSDNFPMPLTRHREETFKQFPGPPPLGSEDAPKYGSHLSRPLGGYGMDGPSRLYDKDPHGYGYDAGYRMPPYHPNETGGTGRPFPPPSIHDDNRGRFDNNRPNPDFRGPMHGFGRHHMGRLPPTSPGNPFGGPHNIDVDGRSLDRQPFGERFPMGPHGHMHRGEFDAPGKPRNGESFGPRNLLGRGEPGFGQSHDYGRSGAPNGPGGFSQHPRFGEPGFRSGYSHQGFPSDGGFYEGGPNSFDPLRKRKTFSVGWCRICKVDCESVEGLEVHGQTREHQRMSMDMVISIKKNNAKRQKTSVEREEVDKLRNTEMYGRAANMS